MKSLPKGKAKGSFASKGLSYCNNGLDPYNYLTWLLKQAKDADLMHAETVQILLPWNTVAESQAK